MTGGGTRRRTAGWLFGSACALAMQAAPALAQQADPPPPAQAEPDEFANDPNIIIVIGQRVIVASLADLAVEDQYDEDDVASYAADTVGEVLGEIEGEKGDDAPALLVNGRPVADGNDIADLPAEAVRRIEVLPRGAAQRIGGGAGQRAYNIVLKNAVRSATATVSRDMATEGGWANQRGDLTLTRVKGQDRANASLRGAYSSKLYENERDFIARTDGTPYAPLGNIIPASGNQVDPAFSAFASRTVGVIGIPAGLAAPTFASLLPGADLANPEDLGAYRTLRGSARPIDLSVSGNKVFSPKLSLSLNGRLGWLRSESGIGLPSARFLLPASHPASPFSSDVAIAVNDPTRPLTSVFSSATRSLSATLNGTFGTWRGTFNGRWDNRDSRYATEYSGQLASPLIDPAQSPFDGTLGLLIPVAQRTSKSESTSRLLSAEGEGPIAKLWAGTLRGRVGVGATWIRVSADNLSATRRDRRRELSAKAGLTLPLTGEGFLDFLGSSELAIDLGVLDLGDDTIHRRALGLTWDPADWLHVTASAIRDGSPIALELLSAPLSTYPNVPFFDPLTGQTVDVTTVSGGAGDLRHETSRLRSLGVSLSPLRKYRLQLEAEYRDEETRDPLGFLPPPSSALVTAFPDRFQRDANGVLVLVDMRPVNFYRENERSLRLRASFTIPLSGPATPVRRVPGQRRKPPLKLSFNGAHSFVLDSTTVLRPGLPEIDLKKGGAIGISGGQLRDRSSVTAALTRGGTGIRVQWQRRGRAYLVTGTLADPNRLAFAPLATFDLKAFADLGELAPKVALARKARLTVGVDNLFNRREHVRDLFGIVPQAYQPVRRDPVGRTVMVELRKQF